MLSCRKGSKAVRRELGKLRFLVFGVVAIVSVSTAVAFALGYVWSGAWLRAPMPAITSLYLLAFFLLGWLLIPSAHWAAINLLWGLSVAALVAGLYALLAPGSLPIEVKPQDLLVIAAVPLSAYAYRRLGKGSGQALLD